MNQNASWFGFFGHINNYRLFNAKNSLYIFILNIYNLLIHFMGNVCKWAKILLQVVKWLEVFYCISKNQLNTIHLFKHS